jgi:hypothetical protein
VEFARWLDRQAPAVAERWLVEVRARSRSWDVTAEPLIQRFFSLFVSVLPQTLGPYRKEAEELWARAGELFGAVSARRGLAAGEVIEEFQLLRECLLRLLLEDGRLSELSSDRGLSRDILRMNRIVDQGVTQASIGHTDVLFFTMVQGSGVSGALEDEFVAEVDDQLDGLRVELGEVLRRSKV